jgi:anti-anti-sigma factor
MNLKIVVAQKPSGFHELALNGRLDTETYGELEAALKKIPLAEARGVRLDLAGLDYISSMGLRVIMKLAKELRAQKAVFQMVNVQPQIKKVFDIAAALPAETVFRNMQEADAYLDAMQKKVLRKEVE